MYKKEGQKEMKTKLKPFIGYVGGKSKYIKYLEPHFPKKYNTYYEPFLGSGAVFLHLRPNNFIISDTNQKIMWIWKSLSYWPILLQSCFNLLNKWSALPFEKKYFEEIKTKTNEIIRKIKNNTKNWDILLNLEAEHLLMSLIFLTRNGCASKLQEKADGTINPTFNKARGKWLNPQIDNLVEIHNYLFAKAYLKFKNEKSNNGFSITEEDYKTSLQGVKKGDFVYLDPPYDEKGTLRKNNNYYKNQKPFSQTEFANEVKRLDKLGAKVLMTNADTNEIRELYKEFEIIPIDFFSALGKHKRKEIIIKNYE